MSDYEIIADAERRFHEEEASSNKEGLCYLAVMLALYFAVVFYLSGAG